MFNARKPPLGARLIPGHPLADGLIDFWVLNEGDGNEVLDSFSGQRGMFVNSPEWVPEGVHFVTGDNDNILLPSNFLFSRSLSSTVVWFSTTSTTVGTLYGEGHTTNSNILYKLSINTDSNNDRVRLYVRDSGGSFSYHYATFSGMRDGKPHCVASTYDFTADVITLYFDGIEVFGTTSYGNPSFSTPNSARIGAVLRSLYLWPLTGTIYAAARFGKILSPSEVWRLSTNSYAMFEPDPIWWMVHSGVGGDVNAPTGTIYGPLMGPLGGPV